MADTMLNVVNDNDEVVGKELRSVIHRTGLRHREVHIWFLTQEGDLIAQRRGANKDTFPNVLDATAGGHVEAEQTYLEAALAEVQEETGLDVAEAELIPLAKVDVRQTDEKSGVDNCVFRMVYLFKFAGSAEDLLVEDEAGAGFETIPLEQIFMNPHKLAPLMIPGLFDDGYAPAWDALKRKLMAS